MSKFFVRNISGIGRLVRGGVAMILLVSGAVLVLRHRSFGLPLLVAGGFVLFEALKGWCALRACGFKTRI